MTNQVLMEKHKPCFLKGVIGCGGYANTNSIVCMTANGDNNFIDEGIVENSILFVDTSESFIKGLLNVFKLQPNCLPQYKLSREEIPNASYFGKVIMAIKQYQ